MTTTLGLGILLLMHGNASECLDASQCKQKASPEYVSTSENLYERCSIYHTMGYGNLLYKELISLSFKTDRDAESMVHLVLTTYSDTLSKTVGRESAVRVIDHVIQALPEVDHKARAVEQLKQFKLASQSRSTKLRSALNNLGDDERLITFENRSKERSAGWVFHLLAKKAELLGDTNRKDEVIEQLSLASTNSFHTPSLRMKYANLIRDLNLMGSVVPAVRFGDVLNEKRVFHITKGKVVVLISSTSRGASEWSRSRAKMPDLYANYQAQGLDVFTVLPPREGANKHYRDTVAQHSIDYGIQWPIVKSSLNELPIIQTPRDNEIFFHPSNRSQLTIIDRKGVIRYIITENSDYNAGYPFEKVKEKVVRLLAEEG